MTKSPNRLLGVLFGAVFLLVGALGFFFTNGVGLFATDGGLLLGIIGLFILDSAANILAINGADNVLHVASAAVLLAVGLGADKSAHNLLPLS